MFIYTVIRDCSAVAPYQAARTSPDAPENKVEEAEEDAVKQVFG